MRILILSDIHDHIVNLQQVIELERGEVDALIGCGDYVAPFVASYLKKFAVPTYACLGNNDGDYLGLVSNGGDKFTWFKPSQEFGEVDLGGQKIAFCHYPRFGELLAESGDYDAVFYGHTHRADQKQVGSTVLVNPGAVCGIVEGRLGTAGYVVYDTESGQVEMKSVSA